MQRSRNSLCIRRISGFMIAVYFYSAHPSKRGDLIREIVLIHPMSEVGFE